MSFETTYDDDLLILGEQVVIGTAMLGRDFGTIKSASVKRSGDKLELEGGSGNLRALVLLKPGFEMILEVAFDLSVEPPGLLDRIALPLVGVVGRVMPGVEVKWEAGKERGLSIPVSSWDSMANVAAYSLDPVTGIFTPLDAAAPGSITADSTVITGDSTLITGDHT